MQQEVCAVQRELLEQLREITEEERRILNGEAEVDRDLYTSGSDFTIDSNKMLEEGKLIAIRTHTRFVHFPLHRHNYVEVLYVCEGTLTNIIDGKQVIVRKGELLFLNQFTHHEILAAGRSDIAINFMVLPEFFDVAYSMAGNNNVLADFLVNVLRRDNQQGEYLHFKVSEVLQIQNLLENIIYSLVTGRGNQNKINQTTMGLIFLYLMDSVQYVEMRLPNQYENMISMTTLDYIEQKYRMATLTELCDMLHLPMHVLSKMIKKQQALILRSCFSGNVLARLWN